MTSKPTHDPRARPHGVRWRRYDACHFYQLLLTVKAAASHEKEPSAWLMTKPADQVTATPKSTFEWK